MFRKYVKIIKYQQNIYYSSIASQNAQLRITCKRTEFNLSAPAVRKDIKRADLASGGWQHYKSKGDHFILHALSDQTLEFSQESFENMKLLPILLKNLTIKYNISKPTNIQAEAIPIILKSNHTLLAAETGCGKSLTFLLPIITHILERKHKMPKRDFNSPIALIITPGRELATQIGTLIEELVDGMDLKVKTILGGRTKQQMLNPSFEDFDVLVATIGAISKLVTTGIYRIDQVRHVVLDEADTLLDDSFTDKLCHFLKKFQFHQNDERTGTQLILASATMPTNTEDVLRSIIDPKSIERVVSTHLHKILPNVTQKLTKADRPATLLRLVKLDIQKNRPVIVFGNKAVTSDFISIFLNDNGVNCINLNGDMMQKIRIGRFEQFQKGLVNILASTDIGSRGLDTNRARHIINFDFPLHSADYIHRCGRTGRVGGVKYCNVTNFISSLREIELVQQIERAARTQTVLPNVNANISNIIKTNIMQELEKQENLL